jgi:hypothetical protein
MQVHPNLTMPSASPKFGNNAGRRAAQITFIAALALAGAAGDSVSISQSQPAALSLTQVCDSAAQTIDTDPETAFSLPIEIANQLLKSADGMQEDPNWPGYPKHSFNTWGVGFTNTGKFETDPSDKTDPNGALAFKEALLAASQLGWDMSAEAQDGNDDTINTDPVTPDLARQFRAFFASIFWNAPETSPPGQAGKLRPGADADGDGKFTAQDLLILSHGKGNITAGNLTRAGC